MIGCMVNCRGYAAVGNVIPYLVGYSISFCKEKVYLYLSTGLHPEQQASYLTATEMGYAMTSCTEEVQSRYESNTALCNWMLAAFTIGYAGFGALGGLMQLYCSTRCVALLGGSLVFASYFITSFYTGNVYIQLCCGFGILYGIGCGIMWRFACNLIFRCFPCFISVMSVSPLSPSIVCVIRWFPQSKALLTGAMMSALGMGSIALSMTETLVC